MYLCTKPISEIWYDYHVKSRIRQRSFLWVKFHCSEIQYYLFHLKKASPYISTSKFLLTFQFPMVWKQRFLKRKILPFLQNYSTNLLVLLSQKKNPIYDFWASLTLSGWGSQVIHDEVVLVLAASRLKVKTSE